MDTNKETALRLWDKQSGKRTKGCDFAGREIAKAAYSDRNRKYGWNVDHIKPESRGEKTADHKLICCHILTNAEKADSFPCFKANGEEFEIRRRQNHYGIFSKYGLDFAKPVNFFDAAQGIEFLENYAAPANDFFLGHVEDTAEIK